MNRTALNRIIAALLVSALAFGQIGAGFLHNKHDAHETIVDLATDQPVLLNHGEHCKVCAVDWMHPAEPVNYEAGTVAFENSFSILPGVTSPSDASLSLKNNRAPPVLV